MIKCRSCGNIIDKNIPDKTYYFPVCPECANRKENEDFMRALRRFAYGENNRR